MIIGLCFKENYYKYIYIMELLNHIYVVTAVVNNPEFIEMQYQSLKKYMKIPYTFIVFNDAKDWKDFSNFNDVTIKNKIKEKCLELGISCIDVPNQHHKNEDGPANRCADAMNFIRDYMIHNQNRYLLLDSDMFLINDFNDEYKNYDAAIVYQKRWKKMIYPWNGIFYFNMPYLKNQDLLDWSFNGHGDVGMNNNKWLMESYGEDNKKLHKIQHLISCQWDKKQYPPNLGDKLLSFLENDPRNEDGKFFCEIYDNIFFHYRAGGNWRKEGKNTHNDLSKNLKSILI